MALMYEDTFQTHIDSLDFGESVRINHKNCEAGEDTRRRLYLTKPASGGGEVLAYCHNCQQGNRWVGGESYRISTERTDTTEKRIRAINMSEYEEFDNVEWPGDAKQEIFRYGIGGKITKLADVRYDPSTHRIVFPIYNSLMIGSTVCSKGVLKGIQKKRLVGSGTKYITEMNSDSYDLSSIITHTPMPDQKDHIGVIVEDYLSGLRIIQWGMLDFNLKVLVNYGTKVNPEAIKNLTDVSKLVVWLDNDSAHVKEQAKTIGTVSKLIQPSSTFIKIEGEHDDPKKAASNTIREVLCG